MVGVNGDPRSDDDRALTRAAAEVAARRGHEDALADERGAIIDARVATNMPIALSFLLGLGLKVVAEQRRRARLIKYIQESDAQAPFVSGELQDSMAYTK